MSSEASFLGLIGELGPRPGLGRSRREVRRLSSDGENVRDRGDVRDSRRGEEGATDGVPGVKDERRGEVGALGGVPGAE